VLLLLVGSTAVAWTRLREAAAEAERGAESAHVALLAGERESNTRLNVTRTIAIAKAGGAAAVEAHFAPQMKATSARISAIQKDLDASVPSGRGRELLTAIGARRSACMAPRGRMLALLAQGELADTRSAALRADLQRAGWVLAALLLASLAVGGVTAWVIACSIVAPLRTAADAAGRIAQGELLRALVAMQAALQGLVGQVRNSAQNIQVASSEVASGSADLSARTEQAASSLQQTAASMEQRGGRGGARRRAGPRLRGRRRRGAGAGRAFGRGRARDRGADRGLGRAGRSGLGAGGRRGRPLPHRRDHRTSGLSRHFARSRRSAPGAAGR
jgi:methyl-accepting chemotaxis protein